MAAAPTSRYGALGRNRAFRFYFLSLSTGEAGYAVYAVGVIWLALTLSDSALFVGAVIAVEFGIYSLSFVVGPLVDRVRDLRTILLLGFPAQGALALGLGALAYRGELTGPLLLGLIVALSLLWDFTWTALNATLPRIVAPDQLFLANGLTGAVSGGNQIAGFAFGAALVVFVGPAGGMLLYGALNLAAAVLAIPLRAPLVLAPSGGFVAEMREGWRYLWTVSDPPLRPVLAFGALQGFFSAAAPLLITLLAAREFGNSTQSYGLLFTAFAVGGVAGNILLGHLSPRRAIGLLLAGATIGEGALILLSVSVAPSLWLSLPAWFAVGIVDVGVYTGILVFLQATTPTQLMGRTLTNAYLFRGSSRAVGALVLGALAGMFVLGSVAGLVAVFFVAVGVGVPAVLPSVRRLRF